MPRVKPLSDAQRRAESKRKADETFKDVLALYKSRNSKTDEQVAERLGWQRLKICRMKKDPGRATLDEMRDIMHSLGASAEDWLRLGWFN